MTTTERPLRLIPHVPECSICRENYDVHSRATMLAAQSVDEGLTVTWVICCDDCYNGWWDGLDFYIPPVRLIKPALGKREIDG